MSQPEEERPGRPRSLIELYNQYVAATETSTAPTQTPIPTPRGRRVRSLAELRFSSDYLLVPVTREFNIVVRQDLVIESRQLRASGRTFSFQLNRAPRASGLPGPGGVGGVISSFEIGLRQILNFLRDTEVWGSEVQINVTHPAFNSSISSGLHALNEGEIRAAIQEILSRLLLLTQSDTKDFNLEELKWSFTVLRPLQGNGGTSYKKQFANLLQKKKFSPRDPWRTYLIDPNTSSLCFPTSFFVTLKTARFLLILRQENPKPKERKKLCQDMNIFLNSDHHVKSAETYFKKRDIDIKTVQQCNIQSLMVLSEKFNVQISVYTFQSGLKREVIFPPSFDPKRQQIYLLRVELDHEGTGFHFLGLTDPSGLLAFFRKRICLSCGLSLLRDRNKIFSHRCEEEEKDIVMKKECQFCRRLQLDPSEVEEMPWNKRLEFCVLEEENALSPTSRKCKNCFTWTRNHLCKLRHEIVCLFNFSSCSKCLKPICLRRMAGKLEDKRAKNLDFLCCNILKAEQKYCLICNRIVPFNNHTCFVQKYARASYRGQLIALSAKISVLEGGKTAVKEACLVYQSRPGSEKGLLARTFSEETETEQSCLSLNWEGEEYHEEELLLTPSHQPSKGKKVQDPEEKEVVVLQKEEDKREKGHCPRQMGETPLIKVLSFLTNTSLAFNSVVVLEERSVLTLLAAACLKEGIHFKNVPSGSSLGSLHLSYYNVTFCCLESYCSPKAKVSYLKTYNRDHSEVTLKRQVSELLQQGNISARHAKCLTEATDLRKVLYQVRRTFFALEKSIATSMDFNGSLTRGKASTLAKNKRGEEVKISPEITE